MAKRFETLEIRCGHLTSDLLYTIFSQFIHLKHFTFIATCIDQRSAVPPQYVYFYGEQII